MANLQDKHFDINMIPSQGVRKRNHIRKLLSISLVLKIDPNTVQTIGTTDKR